MPRLGEITLFPRRVSIIEMKEISQQGFTFEALSSGKLAFQPQKTPLTTTEVAPCDGHCHAGKIFGPGEGRA